MDQETEIALLKQEVGFLKTEVICIKEDVRTKFDRIEKKLDDAIKGRPTWATTIVFSSLMTVCCGLIVFLVTRG